MNILKNDFPIFKRTLNGRPLVYLDNAATSQKPHQVITAIKDFYENHNANVHRGIYTLSEEASTMYEDARETVANFIGATHAEEITFTKGATESLNRINYQWGVTHLKKDDVILTTLAEHHSNFVPWQILAKITGATLDFIELNSDGTFSIEKYKSKLSENVKFVAVSHASNVLGTIFPIKEICKLAHAVGAKVSVDGAQAMPHLEVNMQSLACDFYAFSGHKMLGPTGIGVLFVKKELLFDMAPYEYGGGMISSVEKQTSTWAPAPEKFEAGTPNIAGAIGLAAAINYLEAVGMQKIRAHELELTHYALDRLSNIDGLRILGPEKPEERTGLLAFTINGVHSHDIAAVLSSEGIAVRSGHHCAMPLHKELNVTSSTRASFYLYNTKADIDALLAGIKKALELLA